MQPELTAHDGSGAVTPGPLPVEEQLANEVARLRKVIADLVRHVGRPKVCTGPNCKQPIWQIFHEDTKRMCPYNADGTSHFITCPDRELFHGRKHA